MFERTWEFDSPLRYIPNARMAELVDALRSGRSVLKDVSVQVRL